MMVPEMQRVLIENLVRVSGGATVFDPYVGSGTTLSEAMLQGLDFHGVDINPLAILLCRTKSGPFHCDALERHAASVVDIASADRRNTLEISYDNWRKWFPVGPARELSRLRRAIRTLPTLQARRFFWVALAETVRRTSNSRTSTVKLHMRSSEELRTRKISPLAVFEQVVDRNLDSFREYADILWEKDLLQRGFYVGTVTVDLADACDMPLYDVGFPVLVTSPPYGDNPTTVTYGQHSFLPLHWIDLEDIDPGIDAAILDTTWEIDRRSLGGVARGVWADIPQLVERSAGLAGILRELEDEPADRRRRVATFWRDFDVALGAIMDNLEPGALMAWTVGSRRVGGRTVPMDRILRELFRSRGVSLVTTVKRTIPTLKKRMASRNATADTINSERVLIFQAPAARATT